MRKTEGKLKKNTSKFFGESFKDSKAAFFSRVYKNSLTFLLIHCEKSNFIFYIFVDFFLNALFATEKPSTCFMYSTVPPTIQNNNLNSLYANKNEKLNIEKILN